jgi:hypothetical protein
VGINLNSRGEINRGFEWGLLFYLGIKAIKLLEARIHICYLIIGRRFHQLRSLVPLGFGTLLKPTEAIFSLARRCLTARKVRLLHLLQ